MKRILFVAGALVAAGLAFEAIAALGDARRYPPPGSVVRVGEHDLHLHCTGTGGPTVVLEAGAMAFSRSWQHVQLHLSELTRTCSYDRAGFGWSEAHGRPPAVGAVAANLRALLREAGEDGPFVVVGHSLGGHHARVFAHTHRAEVVGLVLIDARHPDAAARLPTYADDMANFATTARLATILARVGVTRIVGDLGGSLHGLPEDVRSAILARSTTGRHWAATLREIATLEELDASVASQPPFDGLPVLVIAAGAPSAGESEETRAAWVAMQEDLVTVSDDARLQVVDAGDHLGLLHHPAHALDVARGIATLVVGTDAGARPSEEGLRYLMDAWLTGLETFVDGIMVDHFERFELAGASVTIVRDGAIVLSKGYRFADFASGPPTRGRYLGPWTPPSQLGRVRRLSRIADRRLVRSEASTRRPHRCPRAPGARSEETS